MIDAPTPEPAPGEALVAIAVSGVNFIDVYFRTGLYPAETPTAIGNEAAGVVERVGSAVTTVRPGDRVAYTMVRGSYAEYAAVPADRLVPVPDDVPLEAAAAVMLQGTTAHYLTRSTFPLDATHTCLVHAAAGGLGGLLVQMAKERGARVIGTVSTEEKARQVRALGADHTIIYTEQDFETEVMRLTDGRGVDVVYDSVGRTTFEKGLKVIRPRGLMALVGQSSGPVAPIDPAVLNPRGSLFLTRPSLAHHIATREELLWRAGDLMTLLRAGRLTVPSFEDLPARRRGAGASRSGKPGDHRQAAADRIAETAQRCGAAGSSSTASGTPPPSRMRRARGRSSAPSQRATTIVATPLPIRLVMARASDMKRSTPMSSVRPATGSVVVAASVAASVMKPPPVTAAAPFEVSMRTPSSVRYLRPAQVHVAAPARRRPPQSSCRSTCHRG